MTSEDMNGLHPIDQQRLNLSQWDFSDLEAVYINCTLKQSPEVSNTQGLVLLAPIWLGEAGPGPSYLDEGPGGPENGFTNRHTTFMTCTTRLSTGGQLAPGPRAEGSFVAQAYGPGDGLTADSTL